MQTNFFESLYALNVKGDWIISIKSAPPDRLLVSVMFSNDKITDAAAKQIPPFLFKGSAKEIDEGFFNVISAPVKKTSELFVNMMEYEAAQEKAREESRQQREKEEKEKKTKEAGNKKYDTAMKKVKELEDEGKYREAYAAVPKPADFPGFAEQITEKMEELSEHFDQPSLFEAE